MADTPEDLLAGLRKDRLNDSPDVLLSELREARGKWMEAGAGAEDETAAGSILVAAFSQLDYLLTSGAPLPSAWTPAGTRKPEAARVAEAEHRAGEMEHRYDMLTLTLRDKMAEIADRDATIVRLTAELDDCRNVPVEYVPEAGLEAAMAADPHREDGCLLRTTDGQKRAWAWKAATRKWEQVT